jgi:hypothetical protein
MKADKLGDNDVAEHSSVLGCDATSLGQWLPTFRRTVLPSKEQELLSQWKSITSHKTLMLKITNEVKCFLQTNV